MPPESFQDSIFRFADEYLEPYRVDERRGQIQPRYCPICGGGDRRDRNTFAINITTGQCSCLRGSCGWHGSFADLVEALGADQGGYTVRNSHTRAQNFRMPDRSPAVQYAAPVSTIHPRTEAIESYLATRKLSPLTLDAYMISADSDGNILFPFYEGGKLVYVKHRKPMKVAKNKEWQDPGTKPVLFGMDLCDPTLPLIITEGQLDALSCFEAGLPNAVSVPCGCEQLDWITTCWTFLEKFDQIILFGDNDEPGRRMIDEVVRRLGESRCIVVEDYPTRSDDSTVECKDANEILYFRGPEAVAECVKSAQLRRPRGVLDLADVEEPDLSRIMRIKTNIPKLDRVTGGLEAGTITVCTGQPGFGKLLSDDTLILTSDGWKTHGELVVGDKVANERGEWVKVLHVFPKQYANMLVTFSNGEQIKCHENHEWPIELRRGREAKRLIWDTKRIKENIESSSSKYHLVRTVARSPIQGTHRNDLCVHPYVLGAWLGDGFNHEGAVCSSQKDKCVLDAIQAAGYDTMRRYADPKTGVLTYSFRNLRSGLQEYGMCYTRKLTTKHIPEVYLTASLDQRLELLAGLIDTDGTYDKTRHRYIFSTSEPELRDGFIALLATLACRCNVETIAVPPEEQQTHYIKRRKPLYYIQFSPSFLIPCRIERKRTTVISKGRRVTISSIAPCEPVSGNCIMVEGGIYCAGRSMLPTHNSTLLGQVALEAVEQGHNVCIYSGEMSAYKMKHWLTLQAAGSEYIGLRQDDVKGMPVPYVGSEVSRRISDWFRGHIYLFDNRERFTCSKLEAVMEVFDVCAKRYGCDVFIADNVLTVTSDAEDENREQNKFMVAMNDLCIRHKAAGVVVAHARKIPLGQDHIHMNDISGNSVITKLASTVLVIEKPDIRIIKARDEGRTTYIRMAYCADSRRVYQADVGDKAYYGWDRTGIQPVAVRADSLPEYQVQLAPEPI